MEQAVIPPRLTSRFEFGRVLGRGGRSTVCLAHDPLLSRDVAIKVFSAQAGESEELRAQQAEARMIAPTWRRGSCASSSCGSRAVGRSSAATDRPADA